MIKRIHLVLYTNSVFASDVSLSFNEALLNSCELDFSSERFSDLMKSQDLKTVTSVIESHFREYDDVICFLPNSFRAFRLLLSEGLNLSHPFQCICWYIDENRTDFNDGLQPSACEGYEAFIRLDPSVNSFKEQLATKLDELPNIISRFNNRNNLKVRHRYSSLAAFERLMFLIRSFLTNPELAWIDPRDQLKNFPSSRFHEDQIVHLLLASHKDKALIENVWFISDKNELIKDLSWLRESGFIGEFSSYESFPEILMCEASSGRQTPLRHQFAGWEEFSRLMVLIRHLIFNPGDFVKGEPLNQYLAERLSRYPGSFWTFSSASSVRHYLRVGVKPYIDDRAARKGHFLGSAVVSLGDLSELVSIVSSSAPLLNSPQTQSLLLSLEQRLTSLNVAPRNSEALSSLAERSIVNPESAPPGSVRSRKPDFSELSSAISRRQEIRIQNLTSVIQKTTSSSIRKPDSALVLPLQFVFHRRAWYLAAEERQAGRSDGPIRFLRLDRFKLLRVEPSVQKEERFSLAFSRMCNLVDRTFGLPPNKLSYQDQALVWSCDDSWMTADGTLSVSCRLDHRTWKFVREGPDRLPYPQLRMSGGPATHTTGWKPPQSLPHMDQIYCLPVHDNSDHPFELQMILPAWSVDDFDLQNWLLGFGAGLVLIGPDSFRQKLLERLQSTLKAWAHPL